MHKYLLADLPPHLFDSPAAPSMFHGFLYCDEEISSLGFLRIKAPNKQRVYRNIEIYLGKGIKGRINLHIHEDNAVCKIGDKVDGAFLIKLWKNCEVSIGSLTTANSLEIWIDNGGSVFLGKDCMCAHEVLIMCGDMHGIFDTRTREQINGDAASIRIGEHVWLGRRVTVTKRGSIGKGSLVAAGAVVSKEFGECCVIAGAPGKIIRENTCWTRSSICRDMDRVIESISPSMHPARGP